MINIKEKFMKKILFAMLALGMSFVSCKSSSGSANGNNGMEQTVRKPMGAWKAMEWTSSDKIEKQGGVIVVEVPAIKNNVELNCTNYDRFWISTVDSKGIDNAKKESYKGDFYEIKCEGNSLSVSFDANNAAERSFNVMIQSGDVFSRIQFVQKGE